MSKGLLLKTTPRLALTELQGITKQGYVYSGRYSFNKASHKFIAGIAHALALSVLSFILAATSAQAETCDEILDDTDVALCATQEIQEKIDNQQRIYDQLAEALGPRAAASLPDDQAQWLARSLKHCGMAAAPSLEKVASSSITIPQSLCLQRFIDARSLELSKRTRSAATKAKEFSGEKYPEVASTWASRLDTRLKIPTGRFAAYYFRSGKPATLVASELVDEVSINYPWDQFHGITSEDFEGYWTGRFQYPQEKKVYIEIDQSWSNTSVIIDKKLIYKGSSNARVPYIFSAGTHMIEVEFANNWHTTNLSVTFAEENNTINRSELRNKLRTLAPENTVVQYAGAYESGSQNNAITLNLAASRQPIILVLSSYSAVLWAINNPNKVDIRAIVYSSYAPGSRIQTGKQDKKVPLLHVEGRLGSYDAAPRCNCVGGNFHCEGGSVATTVQSLSTLLGFPVAGFAGDYSPKILAVPKLVITPEVMTDARATLERIGKERGECRKTAHPE